MKDMHKIASVLDKVLKVLSVMVDIAAVCLIVGLGILAAGFLFDLSPALIGTHYEQVDLGFVSFTVAESCLPDHRIIWGYAAMEMFLILLCLIPGRFMVKSIRAILAPMKSGEPFHNAVSTHLDRLARYTCSLGIGMNLATIIPNILTVRAFDLSSLLLSDRITEVEFLFSFDMSFLLVSAVILLLSYVFRYGEKLQQLSDETL